MKGFQKTLFEDEQLNVQAGKDLISLPKIDLHRHLLGSVSAKTVLKIQKKQSIISINEDEHSLNEKLILRYPEKDFNEYIRPWRFLSHLITSPEIVYILAYEALKEASEDNVKLVELRTSWGVTGAEKFPISEFLRSLKEAIEKAETDFGIKCRVVLGITRHLIGRHKDWMRKKLLINILKSALEYKDVCVVGFDLSGKEENYNPEKFKDFFKEAKKEGFFITVHCGERSGSSDISEAINELEADRIGHGLAAVRDEELLNTIIQREIPIETCLVSNYLSGAVPSISSHPIKQFKKKNIKFTINTDNPIRHNCSLSKEYQILIEKIGFTLTDIKESLQNSLEASFVSKNLKQELSEYFFSNKRLNTLKGGDDEWIKKNSI